MEYSRRKLDFIEKSGLLAKNSGRCSYCQTPLSLNTMVPDHKTPRKWGGADELWNMQATCEDCNAQKGDKTDEEYREWLRTQSMEYLMREGKKNRQAIARALFG